MRKYLYTVFLFFVLPCSIFLLYKNEKPTHITQEKQNQITPTSLESPSSLPQKMQSSFPDVQSIIDGGVLKIAMYKEDRAPFFFVNEEGKMDGIDVEVSEAIGKILGVPVEYIRTAETFDEVADQVALGKAHLGISKLSWSDSRARKIIYGEHYITLHAAFLVNRSQLEKLPSEISFKEALDNPDVKIASIRGSSQSRAVRKLFPNAQSIEFEKAEDVVQAVSEGKCFAGMRDDNEVRKLFAKQPSYNLTCAIIVLNNQEDNIHIIMSKEYPNLYHLLQSTMKNRPDLKYNLDQVFRKFEKNIKNSGAK